VIHEVRSHTQALGEHYDYGFTIPSLFLNLSFFIKDCVSKNSFVFISKKSPYLSFVLSLKMFIEDSMLE